MQADVRYHALDSMRASMMLLGIYLHVVVGYSGDGHWPYIDAHPTSVLNWSLGVIHAFRMPAFFAMAGFFGALLWHRRGARSFLENRGRRIVLPFALFWSLMFPFVAWIILRLEGREFHLREVVQRLHPMHLWFLEYLILLYGIGALAAWLVPDRAMPPIHRAYRWGLQKWYAPALCALFSWLPLAWMHGTLKDPDGFMPEWRILVAYVVPFTFGWLLYGSRDLLPRFERHIGWYLAIQFCGFWIYGTTSPRSQPYLKAAGNVTLCWFLTFALLGLFLRYASRPSARWRYMSDSSYWLYIMHLPVVVGMQVAFRPVPLPSIVKIPVHHPPTHHHHHPTNHHNHPPTTDRAQHIGRRYRRGVPEARPEREAVATA
jgi:glucan biosynthesis protein C